MTRKFLFIASVCLSVLVCACKPEPVPGSGSFGDIPETVDDSVLALKSFSFLKEHNAALKEDVSTVISSGVIDDGNGVPFYVDPRSLVAHFEVFAADDVTGVTVSVSAKGDNAFTLIESGNAAADYMRPVIVRLSGRRNGKNIAHDYEYRFHNLNTGMPVLYLFTPGEAAIISRDIWTENCTVYLDAEGKADYDGTLFEEDYYGSNDMLKGRGNSTWRWRKRPYSVKLDKKAGLLGMPKHKRWVLLANAIDRSLIRNRLAYEIAGRCNGLEWTPRNRYVELVMNGKHRGTYLLAEQIKADADRVPIPSGNDALDPKKGGGPGAVPEEMGFLIEIDRYCVSEASPFWWPTKRYSGNGTTTAVNQDVVSWAKNISYKTNYYDGRMKFNYLLKDPDDVGLFSKSSVQFNYIMDYILETEKSVFQSHDLARIDVDSFIDYWLVLELTMNHEPNNPGSCYMYKKPDSAGGKLYAGPAWDFDYGTFNFNYNDGGLYYNKDKCFLVLNSLWYVGLFENAEFRNAVKTRWAALKPELDMDGFIMKHKAYLEKTAELNMSLWPDISDTGDPNGERKMTTEEAIGRIRDNLNKRIYGLDRLISQMP